MELDVHIKREGEESWGFRLIGGKDFNMPLTVVKVIPDSPAERAGLQNGDAVCRINDADACGLAHDDAKMVVAGAEDTLSLAVKRGLYDPVLDEYEPIYEPIDQEDFDQPSQPTEVDPFQVQQFLDPKQYPQQLTDLPELRDIEIPNLNGTIDRSRSLTASPFVLPTKPYRPFSTDPLPVPPLEDPIILNPNYKDDFLKIDDGEVFPETKYKLPISEQYDPDGSKGRARSESVKTTKEIRFSEDSMKKDVTFTEKQKEAKFSEVTQKMTIEEMKFMETMKKEIDLDKIEMTAVSLVDESIERAVSVADEIKKEIDVELDSSLIAEIKESKTVNHSSQVCQEFFESKSQVSESVAKTTNKKGASELVGLIDKTTEEIISFNGSKADVSVAKEVQKFETIEKMEKQVDERKLSTKQELDETIETGSVRRKSEVFDKKEEAKTSGKNESVERKKSVGKEAETKVLVIEDRKRATETKSASQSSKSASEIKKETISTSQKTGMTSLNSKSSSKRTAEQKAYTIGLQTIPNIKGTIHSSYHYNLLLKTFFLHLTDVMVALSRFIITESIFEKDDKQGMREEVKTESSSQYTTVSKEEFTSEEDSVDRSKHKEKAMIVKQAEEVKQDLIEDQNEEEEIVREVVASHKQEKVKETLTQLKQEVINEAVVQQRQGILQEARAKDEAQIKQLEYKKVDKDVKDHVIVEDVETRILSGAKMAQLTERKSEELTNKMDAVISEFENKAGIEESAVVRERRSRSRSKVEEEVMLENDPLEWLSKSEIKHESQNITETNSETKLYSFTAESVNKKRVETLETRESRTSQAKEEPQMYVAIVESHVYTNKDAIFEEMAKEFSEISSVVSANETNIALQSSEIVATEQVALQTSEIKKEVAESILEESRELAVVNARSEKIEMAEDVKSVQEAISEEVLVEMAEEVKSAHEEISEEVIVEMAEEVKSVHDAISEEKVVEIDTKATNEVYIQEIIEPVVEVKELKSIEIAEDIQKVSIKEEEHIMTISEKSEVVEFEAAKHEVLEEIKQEYVIVAEEEHKAVDKAVIEIPEIKTEKVEQPIQVVETSLNVHIPARLTPTRDEASAELSIIKEAVVKDEYTLQLTEESELSMSKHTEIHETDSQYSTVHKSTAESYESKEMTQESSFTAQLVQSSESKIQESSFSAIKSSEERKKLSLQFGAIENIKFKSQSSVQSEPASTINTPTPATVPPTPLTDEYVFKLQIPLPKSQDTTPIPRDPSPEVDEDPHIVKKKLVPHIETTLESPIIYDPPLASPPGDKVTSPVYTKPGLRGGAERRRSRKEEILEIERKSTLLASAIDETIKSIEEYKEEVGIENKKEEEQVITKKSSTVSSSEKVTKQETIVSQPVIYNGYAKVETKVYDSVLKDASKIDEEWNMIDKQVKESNEKLIELSNKAEVQMNGTCDISTEESKTEIKSNIQLVKNSKETPLVNGAEKMEISSLNAVENGDNKQENVIENSKDMHKIRFSEEVECKIVETEPKVSVMSEITPTEDFEHIELPKVAFCGVDTSSSIMTVENKDPMDGYRPVAFNPEEILAAKQQLRSRNLQVQAPQIHRASSPGYVTPTGELLGTNQGIVDGLEEAVVDLEVAKELGKPGMTEDKIAELISGESEMLREAHVMGLSRVLKSHMHRADDDSSVDFKKIKPIIESLKDSEVLKALNEELIRTREEKKKEEEKKWTKFLQKPKRPVPRAKFGYYGYMQEEEIIEVPYKVKIVKQPKPKVAPDYKPEDFETGPLPWEERALKEPPPPPVPQEDPILIPEEVPEFLEAVDPLPESEVPDLEETGIRLPSPKPEVEEQSSPALVEDTEDTEEQPEELDIEAVVEETEKIVEEMEQNRLAEQLMMGVQSMVDPNASIDQQLAQMRAQVAALAQLPGFIQQTLDLVTKQLCHLSHQETQQITMSESESHVQSQSQALVEVTQMQSNEVEQMQPEEANEEVHQNSIQEEEANEKLTITEVEETKPSLTQEEMEKLRKEEEEMLEEQRRIEKQKKEMMEQMRLEQESRQVKQRPTPRVGKPKPVFGPPEPVARPLVLPGGRKWRKPEDAYNEQFIAETLSAQAELIQGKAKGFSYESDILPYDERINFMKYEKPPVSLDHLQNSETYKLIHNMEQTPVKRVEMRTPVIAEADYREKCRSVTPSMNMPQQVHP